jgi:osmotically inducible protein OsmC
MEKVLYTARVHTIGGRDGVSRSTDGRLDVQLSAPGSAGSGTNPEQLFAAGWSACFLSALRIAAGHMKVTLPASTAIDAEVDLTEVGLAVRLRISIPGVGREVAQQLIRAAHETCPYSRATRGHILVEFL